MPKNRLRRFQRRKPNKTTYAGSHRARTPQRPRPHDCGTAAHPPSARARPKPTIHHDAGANRTRTITTPRPTRARAPSPLRRANMSSKAKSPKEEAPLSPTKGKKSTKKKDPKSPAKVKSVTKAAETPVKTSSKKKAAETPQTKPKEKRSGPYEARWKKAMCVARGPSFLRRRTQRALSRRRRRGATPSPRRRHAHVPRFASTPSSRSPNAGASSRSSSPG